MDQPPPEPPPKPPPQLQDPDLSLAPSQVLAELVADLSAWAQWQRLLGAHALPRESMHPAVQGQPAQSSRPAAVSSRPAAVSSRPAGGTARPAGVSSRPAAVSSRPAGGTARPVAGAASSGQKVELGAAWSRFARPGGLLSTPSTADDRLGGALEQALKQGEPAARLRGVREVMGDCRRCGLCERRRQIVFGVGAPTARLVILGEGPGQQEDLQGEPFVGPAGQMLDRMIENVLGLSRSQVYILNMVKCRPPRNRDPQPAELDACRPFLDAQLNAIRPDLVLILGSVATRALLGRGVTRARGRWTELRWQGGSARCMATFHPAYLLRRAQDKRLTFADLKLLRAALDALSAP